MARIGKEMVFVRDKDANTFYFNDRTNVESIGFTYYIDVSSKGVFSTMLPPNIVEKFMAANISMNKNRLNKDGYLSDNTLENLKKQVIGLCEEYLSRKLISSTIVIKYGIETTAAYCISHEGLIVPNARHYWLKGERTEQTDWRNGTKEVHAQNPAPFGLKVYAKPFLKNIYEYKSGIKKEEYRAYNENSDDSEDFPNLHWLSAVCSISPVGLNIKEIVYTEEVAFVFVNMIRSICSLNEKIKDFIEPDAILLMAQQKQNLLG